MNKLLLTIPEAVPVQVDGHPWTFARAVQHVVDNYPPFNHSGIGIRASMRILDALKEGVTIASFERDDLILLNQALDVTPIVPALTLDGKPLILPGRTWLPYLEAVSHALKITSVAV